MEKQPIGSRIRAVIGDSGLTPHAFAKLAGISDTAIRDFMNDRKSPGMKALVAISEVGDVMLDWLILGTGIQKRKDALMIDWIPWYKEKAKNLDMNKDQLELLLKGLSLLQDPALRRRLLDEVIRQVQETQELETLRAVVEGMKGGEAAEYKKMVQAKEPKKPPKKRNK